MTLKAFKDAIKVGVRLSVVDHFQPKFLGTSRVVVTVQGNGYWFKNDGDDPKARPWWGDFPKASGLDFDGQVAKIDYGNGKVFTLRIDPPAAPAAKPLFTTLAANCIAQQQASLFEPDPAEFALA